MPPVDRDWVPYDEYPALTKAGVVAAGQPSGGLMDLQGGLLLILLIY